MISVRIEADDPYELAHALETLAARGLVVAIEHPTDPPPKRHTQRRHLTAVTEGAAS